METEHSADVEATKCFAPDLQAHTVSISPIFEFAIVARNKAALFRCSYGRSTALR